MDKDLLMKLFSIGNSSGNEDGVSVFIKNYFDSMGIFYEEDEYGNIFSLRNTELPILNAHMDSVQDSIDEALTKFIKIRGDIMSGYGVIGGDDKCGLFAILEVLKQREDVNFIITREEEIGCVGMNFFMNSLNNDIKDFPWGLTLDRYGSGDIICAKNDYGIKDFEDALYEVGKGFGYKPAQGLYSDADYMSEGVSCANISVGYYAHHTKSEYVVLSELQNSIKFVIEAIDRIKTNFDAPNKLPRVGTYEEHYSMYDYREDDFYNHYKQVASKKQECFITRKESKHVTFIPSLNDFVSPEGARRLYEDLEQSGILYEELDDEIIEDYYEDDIDELLKGIV